MKSVTTISILILGLLPASLFAQAVSQRTTVGYLNAGTSIGYRGFGGYGFGFSNRYWGGAYGDLLYQAPTQYLDYSRPVYRDSADTAESAQELYRAAYDAYGGNLRRTDAWAARILQNRNNLNRPANVISSAPTNERLWMLPKNRHPISSSDSNNRGQVGKLPSASFKPSPQTAYDQSSATDAAPSNPVDEEWAEDVPTANIQSTATLVRPNEVVADTDYHQIDSRNRMMAAMAVGRGDAAFANADYAAAREHYLRASVALPHEAGPHIAHGLACFAFEDFAAAALSLRTGVSHAPELADAIVDLRDLYGDVSDFSRQFAVLESKTQSAPSDTDLLFVRGFVCQYTGNAATARIAFAKYRDLISTDLLADRFIDRILKN